MLKSLDKRLHGVCRNGKGDSENYKQVSRDKHMLEREFEEQVELDELELEEYIEFVVKEVRRTSEH
jgi:hypothetical protein